MERQLIAVDGRNQQPDLAANLGLMFSKTKQGFIGIDVGGTKILGIVTDGVTPDRHAEIKEPTPKDDPSKVGPAILSVVSQLIEHARDKDIKVVAVGVGVPGLVDSAGVLRYGPNVQGVLNLDVTSMIKSQFSLPAVAENDGTLAALVEHRIGSAQGHDNAILLTQGTGIAGGLIVNGQVVKGAHGFAGEPGHMLIDPNGPMCACKEQGCWEALSSGAGLANIAKIFAAKGKADRIIEIAGGDVQKIRGEHVAQAREEQDPSAELVFDHFATWVALGLSNLCAILDPSIVVLGGGLAAISEHFIDKVRTRLPDRLIGAKYRPEIEVVPAAFSSEAGALGGAIRARDYFINGV